MDIVKFSPVDSKYSTFEIHENDEIICEIVTDNDGFTKILFSEYSSKIDIDWHSFIEIVNEISRRLTVNKIDSLENEDFLKKISEA